MVDFSSIRKMQQFISHFMGRVRRKLAVITKKQLRIYLRLAGKGRVHYNFGNTKKERRYDGATDRTDRSIVC